MKHIRTIIAKEWAEVFKNRLVFFTVVFLPLIFTALPLIMLSLTKSSVPEGSGTSEVPAMFAAVCTGMSGNDCVQAFLLNEFLLFFMMMPLIIPTTIAAYSIVGEKTTRSLEPLLATPVTTEELLIGKAAAASLPAIGAGWLGFIIFVLLIPITGASPMVQRYALSTTWLVGVFAVGPLIAIAAVNLAIFISSKVNDPRTAEQISMVLLIPLFGLLFGQIAGKLVIDFQLMLIVVAVLIAVDIALVFLGAKMFQRETILTRWK
jgi:ABC-2 type transport system permease protein